MAITGSWFGKSKEEKAEKKGFFKSFGKVPELGKEEAFLAVLIGAARADDIVSPEETQEMAALIGRSRTFAGLTAGRLSQLQTNLNQKMKNGSKSDVLAAACETIVNSGGGEQATSILAQSLFCHAVDIVFADREVNKSEQEFIVDLAGRLKIPDERAEEIISVMEVKNAH